MDILYKCFHCGVATETYLSAFLSDSDMVIKKGDFVEIEYTAHDKESGRIFDLTSEEVARRNNIFNEKADYGPIVICIGEKQVLKSLDEFLVGKELGKEYVLELEPENGFGKKDAKLMRMIPAKIFKKQNIQPFPGLQINMDGLIGTVRAISGGRIVMDFNHPLAGHGLKYEIKVNKIITDVKMKIKSLLKFFIKEPEFSVKEGVVEISSSVPEPLQKELKKKIISLISGIKDVKFKTPIGK